ncbi:MAG: hypothetical protein ABI550_04750 [Ignavibacteriaceae bacterium]
MKLKRNFGFYLILIIVFFIGCSEFANLNGSKDDTETKKKPLAVDVEADFKNDSIGVVLDDSVLFKQRATTNNVLNAAWLSGPHDYSIGSHKLVFNIYNLTKSKQLDFELNDTVTIRINYNRQSGEILFQEFNGLIRRN